MSWKSLAASWDVEIRALEHKLHVLKAKRKSITPLYRLPSEILEWIMLCIEMNTNESRPLDDMDTPFTSREWTRVMLACRAFRNVAMHSGALWYRVTLDSRSPKSQAWVHLCIERAGQHPLHASGALRHMKDKNTQRLLSVLPQCRRLCLSINPLHDHEQRQDMYSRTGTGKDSFEHARDCAISHLQSTYLQKSHDHLVFLDLSNHLPSKNPWNGTLFIDETFLGGERVMLTSLHLYRIRVSAFPDMLMLQELHLSTLANDMRCRVLRNILSHTPNISSLLIIHPYDETQDDHFPEEVLEISKDPQINLPRLDTLCLCGDIIQVPYIIQILPSPRANMVVEMDIREYQNVNYVNQQTFLHHIPQVSPHVQSWVASYLSLACTGNHSLTCEIEVPTSSHYKTLDIEVWLPKQNSHDPRKNTFCLMCGVQDDVSDILCWATTIHLRHYPELSPFVRPDEFAKTPHLRHLIVYNLRILIDDPEEADEDAFEELLSKRLSMMNGSPIQRLTMDYSWTGMDDDVEDLIIPADEIRGPMANTWRSMGWVDTVDWDDG